MSGRCIGRGDGGEHRVLTSGRPVWFAATYGDPKTRVAGRMCPRGPETVRSSSRAACRAQVAWEYQPQRPDVDHFNRDFKPDPARGGTEICRLDPPDGRVTVLTRSDPARWDFRASESPDGRQIAFCRAESGGVPAIWVMESDGKDPRLITGGINDLGADHPRWL